MNYFDYDEHALAMQAGVKAKAAYTDIETTNVSLRVGVNAAMVEHAALTGLLIEKGIITEDEYANAIAEAMFREKSRYEAELSKKHGVEVKLG